MNAYFGLSQQDEVSTKGKYLVAYNIFVPDTTKDDWEVMITNMDGTKHMNVTNHPDVAWTYYAYKDRLFFISDRDTAYRNYFLYEMKPNGSGVQKLSDLRLEDSWMSARKGKQMIVAGRIGKALRYQLFEINLKNGHYTQLTSDTSAAYFDPCYSPDGKYIVCAYQAKRRDKNQHEELVRMNADGTEMLQLTHYPESDPGLHEYGYKAGAPRWHPSGEFITYVSQQEGRNQIFAVSPDGSKQWKLFEDARSIGWHDWSDDGNWLTFNGTHDDKQYHIYLMNWQTKEITQLTTEEIRSQLGPVFVSASGAQ
jgi:TolB protein